MENKRTEKVDSTINGADRKKTTFFLLHSASKKKSLSVLWLHIFLCICAACLHAEQQKKSYFLSLRLWCNFFCYKSSSSSFSRSYKRLHIHTHAAHSWMYMDCKCNSLTKNEHTEVILYDYNRINISVKVTRIFFSLLFSSTTLF